MSMGKRERERQPEMWVITTDLPTSASHPFYARLNQLLAEHHFDDFVEGQCQPFYAKTMGRPGLPPGIYFRLLLIGYFEGINTEGRTPPATKGPSPVGRQGRTLCPISLRTALAVDDG